MNLTRLLVGSAVLAAAPAVVLAGPTFTVTTTVIEGDAVAGVGTITTTSTMSVNNGGDWLVEIDTNNANTDIDGALILNGALYLREGDALALPVGASIDSFDSINLNISGDSAWNFFLSGTSGTSDDSGIYFNADLVIQESEFMTAAGFSPSTPMIGIFDVKVNDGGSFVSVLSVDDVSITSTVDRAIVVFTPAAGAGGYTQTIVALEAEVLPGQIDGVADFGTGPHNSAYNNDGHVLFFADLAGSTAVDGTIYVYDALDRLLIAQEGSPSPVSGRNWSSLASPELDLNNADDHVYSGSLDGDAASNLLIVRNGAKFKQEGDTVTTGSGTWSLTSFGTGPIMLDDCGNVVWYGDWDDPDLDIDTGLFLNDVLLVQEGVTVIDGSIVDALRGIEDGYTISDSGRYILFEAQFLDGREGAFLIDFGAECGVEPCLADECGDGNGIVNIVDLLALLAAWAGAGGPCDIVPDGVVNIQDLLALLASWGDCP